ncbi:MAG TPA: carboxylating nicotinate-nucleotide diphosphorylase [Mycobacteriales bacterium]|nr:carboxylating nicotinate-nucleotide diphosphorylase [Mycobacteriales bacterium]
MPESRFSPATVRLLEAAGLDVAAVHRVVTVALEEDLGSAGDITSAATVADPAQSMTAEYVSRGDGVIAGLPLLAATYELVAAGQVTVDCCVCDGERVAPAQRVATVTSPAHALLAAERTTLNLLGRLSGIAGLTRQWVDAVGGTGARIRDTRKTTPGLRDLEKYAVRCGGGVNHRRGLFDAYLVKDNHVAAAGGVTAALNGIDRVRPPGVDVQVEVDDMDQLVEALAHHPPSILLDNFSVEELAAAVRLIRSASPGTTIEASGGLQLANAREVALTGVDYLAVGQLTHSAPQLDIGLDVRQRSGVVRD